MSEPKEITAALEGIARASQSPRELAKEAVGRYRQQSSQQLSQALIDGGYDEEERRRRFVSASVKFRRRSIFARLRFW